MRGNFILWTPNMLKTLLLTLVTTSILLADSLFIGMSLTTIQDLDYEDQFEKRVKIPKSTRLMILTYEKDQGAIVNDLLAEQNPTYLKKQDALFIADISKMPSLITMMFALPKMQKFKYPIYLNYGERFARMFPAKKEKITLLYFNTQGYISDIVYISTKEGLKKALQK